VLLVRSFEKIIICPRITLAITLFYWLVRYFTANSLTHVSKVKEKRAKTQFLSWNFWVFLNHTTSDHITKHPHLHHLQSITPKVLAQSLGRTMARTSHTQRSLVGCWLVCSLGPITHPLNQLGGIAQSINQGCAMRGRSIILAGVVGGFGTLIGDRRHAEPGGAT